MINLSELLLGTSNNAPQGQIGRASNGKPLVMWSLTRASDLKCIYCYTAATASPQAQELSFDEGVALLDDLKSFGVPAIVVGGGEPLVRPDALDLLHHARHIGLNCSLTTSGQLLTDSVADRLATMGLGHVILTIDGAPERHDRINSKAGAFDAALAALRRCKARKIKVGVKLTVHAMNCMDVPAIFRMCQEERVDRLCLYHVVNPEPDQHAGSLYLSPEQTRMVVEDVVSLTLASHLAGHPLDVVTVGNHADAGYLLLRLEQTATERVDAALDHLRQTAGNRVGTDQAMVDPQGDVHYDEFSTQYSLGNVRQAPFSRIWSESNDERLHILRDRVPHLSSRCQRCRFVEICNGNIRTRAETLTGDWLAPDPGCYLSEDERSA